MISERINSEDTKRRFCLTEHVHETQKHIKKLEQFVEFSSDMKQHLLAQVYFKMSFIGYGLKHMLKSVGVMLELIENDPHKGKRMRLERPIVYLYKSV